jgi:hypothetical protein
MVIYMDDTKIPYVFETPEYWTDEYINWETFHYNCLFNTLFLKTHQFGL